MRKLLIHKIREGQFDQSKSIQKEIDDLISNNKKAQKTLERMHKGNHRVLHDSMSREFRSFSLAMRKLTEKKIKDEEKRLANLRNEFKKVFKVDIWDEVLFNPKYEFDTVEEFFECAKLYYKENYV